MPLNDSKVGKYKVMGSYARTENVTSFTPSLYCFDFLNRSGPDLWGNVPSVFGGIWKADGGGQYQFNSWSSMFWFWRGNMNNACACFYFLLLKEYGNK